MNIALYHNLPSGGAKRGLYEMVRRLCSRHTVHSFVPSTADQAFCDYSGFVTANTIVPFRLSGRFKRPLGRLNNALNLYDLVRLTRVEEKLARKIDAEAFDVVFVFPSQWTQSPSLLRRLKTPTVYYCQESLRHLYEPQWAPGSASSGWRSLVALLDPLPKLLDGFVAQNDRLAICSATRVVVNSRFSASEIERIYDIQPLVAYLGVDIDFFRPLALERDSFVLSVGALLPHKGFDFIIRSLALIPRHRRPRLVIASNAESLEERLRLESIALREQVEVTLLSPGWGDGLVRLYNQCQLVVYASHNEPFGLVPLEAMACGTPVVAVREGGPAESILDNETGILTERNEPMFAEAVDRLLEDSTARMRLGSQAIEHVTRSWTWDSVVQRLDQILIDTAHGAVHKPPRSSS